MKHAQVKLGMKVLVNDPELSIVNLEGEVVAIETNFIGVDFKKEIIRPFFETNRLPSLNGRTFALETPTGYWLQPSYLKAV